MHSAEKARNTTLDDKTHWNITVL